jgi:hypothetical protein
MAIRTSSGTTLPENLTIIPSEQKWVFHAIHQLAFSELYSNEVCSQNCVVITDEDEAEYRSFESVIETSKVFSRSKVMICTFCGIWMAFKKDLLALLDESEHGKIYGKLHDLYTNSYLPICSDIIYGLTYANMYKCICYL